MTQASEQRTLSVPDGLAGERVDAAIARMFGVSRTRAADLIGELEKRVPELDAPITVNVNGCPNSCARIQTADIGLKGQLVLDENGDQVEGFQVHLGGALGLEAGFGRKLRAHKVTGEQLPDYVEKLSRTFLEQRDADESFAHWVARADEEVLR